MARILNLEAYPLATTISDDSYLVGTDVTDNKETKNFKIEDLKTHILPPPLSPSGTFENATVVVDSVGQISSVTQGASGSSKWSFSPNADDIYRNSNVGIGDFSAADPAQELEVQGKVQVSGADAEFIGDINGAIRFSAKAGEALSKGDVVYISEISGNIPVVSKADASDSAKMPAFGLAFAAASLNSSVEVITFGTLSSIDTSAFSLGDTVYVSTTAGELTNTPPTGEANLLQNIGKVQRVQASSGSIKVGGAGRTNATPNLNEGSLFIGNSSNQSSTLAIGGANTFLKSDGTTASWAAITFNNDLQDVLDNGSTYSGTSTIIINPSNGSNDHLLAIGPSILNHTMQDGTNTMSIAGSAGAGWTLTADIDATSVGSTIDLTNANAVFEFESSGATHQTMTFNGTDMTITDTTNTKGLIYAADYSGAFVARSLVDKAYVDSNVPSGVALVGTYTDGYVPRWNATTNTLGLSNIKDDGTTISISSNTANTPDSTTDLSVTAGLDKRALKVNQSWGPNEAAKITVSRKDLGTSPTTAPVTGLFIDATSGKEAAGDFKHIKLTTELSIAPRTTPKTIDNVFGIQLSDYSAVSSVTANNLYQIYLGDIDALTKGSGEFYGIYQKEASIKNYLAGQLQLNHTAGTAGQFLKSADTSGNSEWSTISASDVTGAVTATTGAAQRVAVFDGTDSIEGDANFLWNNYLQVTSSSPEAINVTHNAASSNTTNVGVDVYLTSGASASNSYGVFGRVNGAAGGNAYGGFFYTDRTATSQNGFGVYGKVGGATGNLGGASYGGFHYVQVTGAVNSGGTIHGSKAQVTIDTTGTHTSTVYGVASDINYDKSGGTLGTAVGFYHSGAVVNTGTITSAYGIYLGDNTGTGTITNSYGVFQVGADDKNYFAGQIESNSQIYSAIQTSTYTPTGAFQIDWDLGNVAIVDLGSASGTINIGFTNQKAGANYFIKVIQHATTPVDLNWPSTGGAGGTYWPSDTPPVISTGANAIDGIALTCISTNELLANFSQDYQ